MRYLYLILIFIYFANPCFAKNLDLIKNDTFYPTQSDMLNLSNDKLQKSNAQFDKICNNIVNNFKSDKNFVCEFSKTKNDFLNYKLQLKNNVLPNKNLYGSNYSIYANSFLIELNNFEIKRYKRMVEMYCLYNKDILNSENCSKKQIKSLFY